METRTIQSQAAALIEKISTRLKDDSLGSFTVSIYDTAWVAMVPTPKKADLQWRFPEAFDYLLQRQLPSGGWESTGSKLDGILNTLAALLALKLHDDRSKGRYGLQIEKAQAFLDQSLNEWDIPVNLQVGTEILVLNLLRMLDSKGFQIFFPAKSALSALYESRLKAFDVETLYTDNRSTLVHSLEAFVGQIEFDKVQHHLQSGSMMGSPAATAAYLAESQSWDEEAEGFLEKVIRSGTGNGSGGVPSAFPTPVFESSWVITCFYLCDDLPH